MDKTRVLPPRVRGKVTGTLDFFVDEINLFKNALLLTKNSALVLSVQWWGENLPALIRPKVLYGQAKTIKNCHSSDSYYHSAKYEIKTTLDLFKSYLKTCEVIELSVLEAFENHIVGSAFLRDLITLLKHSSELITLPVFDCSGEEIGEVIIHISFLKKPLQKYEQNENKNPLCYKNMYLDEKPNIQNCDTSNKIKSTFTIAAKTFHHDAHAKRIFQEEVFTSSGLTIDRYDVKKNKIITSSDTSPLDNEISNTLSTRQDVDLSHKSLCKSKEPFNDGLPEIKTFDDSSKVLTFGLISQQPRHKLNIKNRNFKVTHKFNSNSIKCKSKPKSMNKSSIFFSAQEMCDKKKVTRKFEVSKNLPRKVSEIEKGKQSSFDVLSSEKPAETEMLSSHMQPELQNIPSKKSSDMKVLDYLLGSDMSKEDEKTALNDFKKMSPSHNLVESISHLCLISDSNSQTSGNNMSVSLTNPQFNFDFNNPVERNYFTKFFLKSNSAADFEIAEFLNQVENSCMLGKTKFSEFASSKNGSNVDNLENHGELIFAEKEIKEAKNENCVPNEINVNRTSSCARCKYYKKLDELDAIIESLKHFEQKMLLHEKDLQSAFKKNSAVLRKKNQEEKDS